MQPPAIWSLRHLKVFEAVARLQSVRKAAEAVRVTQPAVTQAVAKLESQIGTRLFERRSSGTYLTPAGLILSSRVRRLFEQTDAALAGLGLNLGQPAALLAERMTRSQIRAFVAIAHDRIADEAERAGISQTSILHSARELERGLGCALLRHGSEGLSATPQGMEFAARLLVAMREVDSAIEEIRAEAQQSALYLRVGVMPQTASFLIAPVMNALSADIPHLNIELHTGENDYLLTALVRGEMDFVIGLCGTVDIDKIVQEKLVSLPYVLVARKGHPLARKSRISGSMLSRYELIAPNPRAARRVAFDRLVASLPQPPATYIQATSLATVRLLLTASDRLALLTRFEFEQENNAGELAALPFGPIEPAHSLGVARRANWQPTALHLRFLGLLRAHAGLIGETEPAPPLPAPAMPPANRAA